MFTSKVSYALFSDEDEEFEHGTERRGGEVRAGGRMGLHVSSRESWPPASSELRLALKGLLSEAYWGGGVGGREGGTDSATDPYAGTSSDLPGALSFAIRELSEEEYITVMDPHKLSALDFLKINYTPPRPLGEVITSTALYKYDRTFKLLLRLVRMRFVVDKLWRDSRLGARGARERGMSKTEMVQMKFRVGARHFVTCLSGYVWEIAIGATWRGFETRLDNTQDALEREARGGSAGGEMEVGSLSLSLAGLAAAHGKALDRMMFLSFLRRRQQPVMELVEEILGLILEFAKGVQGEKKVEEMYYEFRRKAKMFADVVRGLSESRGYGDRRVGGEDAGGLGGTKGGSGVGAGEGAVFANLLVRLEMNDCWK